jgi:hypothetical protein
MKNKEVEEIREECRAHVESQLDLHFCSIAEDFDVEYGDITPDQAFRLSKINELLTELSVEYVIQNTK